MPRKENIEIFENTVDVCKGNETLEAGIKSSRSKQIFISQKDDLPDGRKIVRFEHPAKIIISKKRTFEAAQAYAESGTNNNELKGCKVCVLNFASASNPGGGVVNGSGAQEECLCRVSTLYFCLDTDEMWEKFYKPHREMHNPLHNDDIIYTPDITVFKSDTSYPKLLPQNEWYNVDVLTCAAPNLSVYPGSNYNGGNQKLLLTDSQLEELHKKRDRRIFDVAVQNNVDVLILGAFGCGAFSNNPKIVAKVMLNLAKEYGHAFKTIEFAVYCPPYDDSNYMAFKEVANEK